MCIPARAILRGVGPPTSSTPLGVGSTGSILFARAGSPLCQGPHSVELKPSRKPRKIQVIFQDAPDSPVQNAPERSIAVASDSSHKQQHPSAPAMCARVETAPLWSQTLNIVES